MPPPPDARLETIINAILVILPIVVCLIVCLTIWFLVIVKRYGKFQSTATDRAIQSVANQERMIELLSQSVENQHQIIDLLENNLKTDSRRNLD